MTVRKPLISLSGQLKELPSGDTLLGDREEITVFDGSDIASSTSYTTAAYVVIDFDRIGTLTPVFHWYQASIPSGGNTASVRLRNLTDSTDLFETTGISTTGLKSAALTLPTGIKLIALQHKKSGGSGPEIQGGTIHVSTG